MKLPDHNAEGTAGALGALKEVQELLSSHPGFEVVPVKSSSSLVPRTSILGLAIKARRFRRFGAKFEGGLTLLGFSLRRQARTLILDLHWHTTHVDARMSVFIHFVDASGEIRFQGDFGLAGEAPDPLGFFYSRRRVDVPDEAPAGTYHVRLGVWYPEEKRHATLIRFRGCHRESTEWCRNAVILHSLEL